MAYEYTPGIAYDPATGAEIPDFGNGSIDKSDGREAINAYFERNPEAGYYRDQDGFVHHEYEQGFDEEELYQQEVENYYEELPLTEEDAADLRTIAGGDQAYFALVNWAAHSGMVEPEYINEFDAAMDSGDYEQIKEYIEGLLEYAQENGFDPTLLEFDDSDYYEEEEDDYEPEPFTREGIIHWAQTQLPDEMVEQFDWVFTEGHPQQQAEATQLLISIYNQAHGVVQETDYYDEAPVPGVSSFY